MRYICTRMIFIWYLLYWLFACCLHCKIFKSIIFQLRIQRRWNGSHDSYRHYSCCSLQHNNKATEFNARYSDVRQPFEKHIPIKSTPNWCRFPSNFILNYHHPVQKDIYMYTEFIFSNIIIYISGDLLCMNACTFIFLFSYNRYRLVLFLSGIMREVYDWRPWTSSQLLSFVLILNLLTYILCVSRYVCIQMYVECLIPTPCEVFF